MYPSLPVPLGLYVYATVFPVVSLYTHWKQNAGVWVVISCINISSAGAFRQNESVKSVAPLQHIDSIQSCFLSSGEEVEGNIKFYCSLKLCTTGPKNNWKHQNERLNVLYPQNSSSLQMKGIQRNSRMTSAMQDNS